MVRIMIADDHATVLTALATLLDRVAEFEVIGLAADGQEAVEKAQQLRPDVAILDISMPRLNGVQAAEQITATCPDVKVIGLSMHDAGTMESAMLRAGAVAYVEKCGAVERLITAIRDAAWRPDSVSS